MRKLLLFGLILISWVSFGQNQVNVKKATVTDWIIYQGDTLAIVRVSGDTLFVTRGETSLDTMIATTYWTKTGNDIANNNTGKIIMSKDSTYFSGIPDEATKTGRLLHVNQFGKVEYVHFMDLYRDTQDSIRETPTAYTTWVRDTTAGILSPATVTDYIQAANFQYSITDRNTWVGVTTPGSNVRYGTYLGYLAGNDALGYDYNVGIGVSALDSAEGQTNVGVGYVAGREIVGDAVVMIGSTAGENSVGDNVVAIGTRSGADQSGESNTFVGWSSGWFNDGDLNVGIGVGASESTTGSYNSLIGLNSGYYAVLDSTIAIGPQSGRESTTSNSIGIGFGAIRDIVADNIIAIGFMAGDGETTSNQFIIKQSNLNPTPFINGDLLTNQVHVRKLDADTLLSSSDSLYVAGPAQFDSTINANENINIAATTSTVGQFLHNKTRFLHTYTDNAAQPNMFIGETAGNFTTTGNFNYTLGNNAMQSLTTGNYNFSGGAASLYSNTTGSNNVGLGNQTIYFNQTGNGNLALGDGALHGVSGYSQANNVAIGSNSAFNHTGSNNVWIGSSNGYGGESGSANGTENTSIGYGAFFSVEGASYNTGIGRGTMFGLTSGNYNTSLGFQAARLNVSGSNNVNLGAYAGYYNTLSNRIFIGSGDKGSFANDTTMTPIYGNQSAKSLRFNATVINSKGTLANNDVSPSVAGGNVWQYNGTTNSVTLDALDDHVVGAFYTIIGNSDTYTITVIDGTPAGGDSFNLAGGNWVGGSQDVLMLYCIAADAFVEVSRSDN